MAAHALRPARRRLTRRLATLVVAAVTATACLPVLPASANHCHDSTETCTHVGSDGTSITGDLVVGLPDLRSNAGGGGNADPCAGCEYTVVPACWVNSPDNSVDALCGAAIQSCPDAGILFWVYVRHPGGTWDRIGTTCIGPQNDVVRLSDVTADAQEYLEQMTPTAAGIGVRPRADRVVVNKTAYFAPGDLAPMTETFGPAGVRVTITATPSYVWDFGDGSAPVEADGEVAHTYLRAGHPVVTLTTRWTATFTVVTNLGTFGPYPVAGPPIAPTSTRPLTVWEARAELVSH